MPSSRLAIQDIKQRLHNLGMIELDMPKGDQDRLDSINKREASSAPVSPTGGVVASVGGSPLDSPEAVRAKILQALNSPSRADAIVPAAGSPGSLKAVFIKSSSDDIGSKLTILEAVQETEVSSNESIQKSALMEGAEEAINITMGLESFNSSSIGAAYQETITAAAPIKSPQGVRKLHSWLAYFYSSTVKSTSALPSPVEGVKPQPQLAIPEEGEPIDEIIQILSKQPVKGILKTPKVSSKQDFPPPIQKTVFLRQEEVQRLSKFAERYRTGSLDVTEEGLTHVRRRSGFSRRRKLRFDMEKVRYHVTYSRNEYERGGVEYIAKSLTPEIAMMIKRELNEVKKEMAVHEESRHYTQFYQLR